MYYRDHISAKIILLVLIFLLFFAYFTIYYYGNIKDDVIKIEERELIRETKILENSNVTNNKWKDLESKIIKVNGSVFERIKSVTKCVDRRREHEIVQWGSYWLMGNYVQASEKFKCEESVTYATSATYNFLGNVPILVKRWYGPVSIAVYCPGSDFLSTIRSIAYLRECDSSLVKQFVSFHLFFEMTYFPAEMINYENYVSKGIDCSKRPPYVSYSEGESFREKNKSLFMINMARNIARKMSETYYILSSDVEMYPSLNMIPLFLSMVSKNENVISWKRKKVFPIVAFEMKAGEDIPEDKNRLREMVKKNLAMSFHHKMCAGCHDFPNLVSWLKDENDEMTISGSLKRIGKFQNWEPFFIGTNEDPWYDERVSWEGMRDKRIQAYLLCLLEYDFLIPNNAFLIHKPGIKKTEYFGQRYNISRNMTKKIDNYFIPQYIKFYGHHSGCTI